MTPIQQTSVLLIALATVLNTVALIIHMLGSHP